MITRSGGAVYTVHHQRRGGSEGRRWRTEVMEVEGEDGKKD